MTPLLVGQTLGEGAVANSVGHGPHAVTLSCRVDCASCETYTGHTGAFCRGVNRTGANVTGQLGCAWVR